MPGGQLGGSFDGAPENSGPADGQPDQPDQPTELLTFLFADIRGYTRFTQLRGDEAAAKLTAKFTAIVRELVARYNGTVLELRGDEALCVFTSPRQSLRLAVALQQRFVAETVSDADLPMTVGIGVDAGEAVRGEDGYRGGALNLAARLCARAAAGEVLATTEVTHLARTIDGIRYAVLDGVALKGLSDRVRPVRVRPEGEDPAQQMAALLAAATPSTARPTVRWLPQPLDAHPRITVAAAFVAVATVALVLVVTRGSTTPALKSAGENSLGEIDPGNGHIIGRVSLDIGPRAAASGFGSVWTANTDANSVARVDPATRQVKNTIEVGASPGAIATGLGSVWVANSASGTVSRIDPATNQTTLITVGADPGGIAVSANSVWVTNAADGTVARIDPAQNKVVETIEVGSGPAGISAGSDIWVANSSSNTVSKIDGHSHAVTQIHVGNDPKGIAVVGDSVWVTNNLDGTIMRIATSGTSVTGAINVGAEPTQVAGANGHVWVVLRAAGRVVEIDPKTNRIVRTVRLGADAGGITATNGKLWVTTTINPTLHHGGTITINGGDVGVIDPVYLGDIGSLWLSNGSYDGLVAYRHAAGAEGTAVVPDLATSLPDPTNAGKTYTFQLRSGIRWSTGAPVTVLDVQRGLERLVASGFSEIGPEIAGAGSCTPQRCAITGIVADPTARTVSITLVQPDGAFLERLAGSNDAAPATTSLGPQTRPIPATGPYYVSRYVPAKLLVLSRNPYFKEWSAAAQPAGYPDTIEWKISKLAAGKSDVMAQSDLAALAAGNGDWVDARGADALAALQARFGDQLRLTPTETTHGLALNTRILPFSNPLARRALAYAIDRAAVANDWFTPAEVTCESLPPDYPGHRPYCPYTLRADSSGVWNAPDLATAQDLVRQSHTASTPVTVYALHSNAAGLQHVVTALRQIGYQARLVVYDNSKGDYFNYAADSRNKIQAAFFGWVAGDVNAGAFFEGIFQCSGYTPASTNNQNPSGFCDPATESLISQARQAEESSPASATALWARVDRLIVDAAPWIPLVNPTWVDVISKRVHNYTRNPVLGVLFDQMWVR